MSLSRRRLLVTCAALTAVAACGGKDVPAAPDAQ